mmetsp:Transcript_20163/g.57010  ORF Transcript_20163/g.57010 Transcript_20163/m.57010 type:complete len:231 (-) Transcript_20163:331-1023(-)
MHRARRPAASREAPRCLAPPRGQRESRGRRVEPRLAGAARCGISPPRAQSEHSWTPKRGGPGEPKRRLRGVALARGPPLVQALGRQSVHLRVPKLAREADPRHELQHLVDEDEREGEAHDELPVVSVERAHAEDPLVEGVVQDGEVNDDGAADGEDQPRIPPRRHLHQRAELRQRRKRVQHLDHDEHRQRQRGGLHLAGCEVGARVAFERHVEKRLGLEVLPVGTLPPGH